MCREHSDMSDRNTGSDTDFDAEEYRDAVAALCARSKYTSRRRNRKRSKRGKNDSNPRSDAASATRDADCNPLQARGGLLTPRCPPRRSGERRQVVADAPVVG